MRMRRPIAAARVSCWRAGVSTEISASDSPVADCLKKADKRLVDLGGPFLLNPMSGTLDNQFPCQMRQHALHIEHALGTDQPLDDRIIRAGDEQRRLMDFGALPRRCQVPVAVDVAIPVEAATKAATAIGIDELG